mmetsp:Transcript_6683/g.17111  ORF Transcript_6683/g.17111 Transcript_6683/m.17111 type:complete len:534 (-) Transcript_6683:106-1707(-)
MPSPPRPHAPSSSSSASASKLCSTSRMAVTSAWLEPSAFSCSTSARSSSGRPTSLWPWSRWQMARSVSVCTVSWCSAPRPFSWMCSARSYRGCAASKFSSSEWSAARSVSATATSGCSLPSSFSRAATSALRLAGVGTAGGAAAAAAFLLSALVGVAFALVGVGLVDADPLGCRAAAAGATAEAAAGGPAPGSFPKPSSMISRMAGLRFLGRYFSTARPAMAQHSRVTFTAVERTSPLGDSNALAANSITLSSVRPLWSPCLARPCWGMSSSRMPRRPSTTRHALWLRTAFNSSAATSASSDAASSRTASLAASRTRACASPIFSSSCGTRLATHPCTSRGPSAAPMLRTAAVSTLQLEANTLATLSLNRRPRVWHSVRNNSRDCSPPAPTSPAFTCSSIFSSAASRCIQFLLYRHFAVYSPNASTTGPASFSTDGCSCSGGGRSPLYPSGGGASSASTPALPPPPPPPPPTPGGGMPPPPPSSPPGGYAWRPVAPAGTSSLLPPWALGSTWRKRDGVPPASSAILLTAGRSS